MKRGGNHFFRGITDVGRFRFFWGLPFPFSAEGRICRQPSPFRRYLFLKGWPPAGRKSVPPFPPDRFKGPIPFIAETGGRFFLEPREKPGLISLFGRKNRGTNGGTCQKACFEPLVPSIQAKLKRKTRQRVFLR
ncbi:MAG: hypothetical protein CW346_20555 [Bacillaceae bacterium]|nr:hypothetical protein [Bacillaceae bacterium]